MRDSLIIVLFFAVGILLSCFDLYPSGLEQFNLSFYALCFLMFCVGISIGNNPHILLSFRRLSPKFFLLPVCTILGTLAGCYVSSFFFERHSSVDCMAVGAGFGYYSLSSIIITEYKNAELGTIALLSNFSSFFWKTCAYFSRRCHNDGYHFADNNPLLGTGICYCFYFSRLYVGFFSSFFSDVTMFNLNYNKYGKTYFVSYY